MAFTVTSNAVEAAARFDVALALAPAAMQAGLAAAAEGVSAVIVPSIKAHTPVGQDYGNWNNSRYGAPQNKLGNLRDKMASRIVPDGASQNVEVYNTATSAPNPDGSGGGFPYVEAVFKGRKAISAPSDGPWSTGKAYLRTPWGPRKSVKASKPNDFITPALTDAMPGMRAAVAEAGHVAAVTIAEALK